MKSALVFTVEPCSVLNAIVSTLNGSLSDVVINIHRRGMCRLGAGRENGDFINQRWANCSTVSCQEGGSGGGFLQEADKTALIFQDTVATTWHSGAFVFEMRVRGTLSLPCVLMHELLANLVLAISDNEIQIGKRTWL